MSDVCTLVDAGLHALSEPSTAQPAAAEAETLTRG
jgi:hypothetical protein